MQRERPFDVFMLIRNAHHERRSPCVRSCWGSARRLRCRPSRPPPPRRSAGATRVSALRRTSKCITASRANGPPRRASGLMAGDTGVTGTATVDIRSSAPAGAMMPRSTRVGNRTATTTGGTTDRTAPSLAGCGTTGRANAFTGAAAAGVADTKRHPERNRSVIRQCYLRRA